MSASVLTPVYRGDMASVLELLDRLSDVVWRLADGTREQTEARKIRIEVDKLRQHYQALVMPTGMEPSGPFADAINAAAANIIERADGRSWNSFIEGTPV